MQMIYPDDFVLVALLKYRSDLDIARTLGWYRIPLRSSPRTVHVDVLAFYQGAVFEEQRWSVRYAARVQGHELRLRRELLQAEPDHPRADEPYYKIQLGPLFALPQPIPARRWRRFTFLYTSGQRLLSANDVRQLTRPAGSERSRF
jgi:hypothetical protein